METTLEKAKRLRGKCVQYEYQKSKHRFEKLTNIVYKLQDEANEIRKQQIKEHENTIAHNWLMASKGLNGQQILTHTK